WSARNDFSVARLLLSADSSAAVGADRRMQTPKGWFGEMRFFTGGRNFCSESQSCAQSSEGCTSVEYVRWPRPLPKSMSLLYFFDAAGTGGSDDRFGHRRAVNH